MNVELGIAGLICIAMAIGHTAIGEIWILPSLTQERLPGTPFGPPSMSVSMVRVTWLVVTIFVSALGGALLTLAWADDADAQVVLLRWFAVMWLAATAMALWIARRSIRHLWRLPVPLLWIVVAVLCWMAST